MEDISPEIIDALKRLHQLLPERWLVALGEAICETQTRTRYGTIEIVVADGRVVGIDISIKTR
jgi:hypothetical protein